MGLTFSKPDRLAPGERMDGFRCGDPIVDAWAATHASRARERGTAIVYVTRCGDDIAGFYSLSTHSVAREEVSGGWFRRNAPSQVSRFFWACSAYTSAIMAWAWAWAWRLTSARCYPELAKGSEACRRDGSCRRSDGGDRIGFSVAASGFPICRARRAWFCDLYNLRVVCR